MGYVTSPSNGGRASGGISEAEDQENRTGPQKGDDRHTDRKTRSQMCHAHPLTREDCLLRIRQFSWRPKRTMMLALHASLRSLRLRPTLPCRAVPTVVILICFRLIERQGKCGQARRTEVEARSTRAARILEAHSRKAQKTANRKAIQKIPRSPGCKSM